MGPMTAHRAFLICIVLSGAACPRPASVEPATSDGAPAVDAAPLPPAGTDFLDGQEVRHGDDVFRVGTKVRLRKRVSSIPPNVPYNSAKTLLSMGPGQVGTVTRLLVLKRGGVGDGNPMLEVRWAKQPWREWMEQIETAAPGKTYTAEELAELRSKQGKSHVLDEFTTQTLHPSYAEPLPPE